MGTLVGAANDSHAPQLRIRLFGQFQTSVGGIPIPGLHAREADRILAYLAIRAGTEVTYRSLAEVFWPGEARASGVGAGDFPSVRQAMRTVRTALGDAASAIRSPAKGTVVLDPAL